METVRVARFTTGHARVLISCIGPTLAARMPQVGRKGADQNRDRYRQREVWSAGMSLTDLSSVFWRLRELLELLLFKLEEEQLLLASGRTRWVAHATREVELVLDQIRRVELVRATHTHAVARELGLPSDVSLVNLANRAPAPWSDLLHQHRRAFLALTAE